MPLMKGNKMYKVYSIENDKKLLANEFQNECMARLYKASFETYLKENYPKRDIKIEIE